MSHINVYVEEFTDIMSAREVPLAKLDDVDLAMEAVEELDQMYRGTGSTPVVPEEWHRAAVLDFYDWLSVHLPMADEPLICQRWGHLPITQLWCLYNAAERTGDIEETAVEIWEEPPVPAMVAQANLIAGHLAANGLPMTLSAVCDMPGLDSIFVPAPETEVFVGGAGEEYVRIVTEDSYTTYLDEMSSIILCCLRSSAAALSFALHADDVEIIGSIVFAFGHFFPVPYDCLPAIIEEKSHAGDEMIMSRLAAIAPHSFLETQCVRLASAVMGTLADSMRSSFIHFYGNAPEAMTADEGVLGVSTGIADFAPFALAQSLTGAFAEVEIPDFSDCATLSDFYDEIMDSSPFVGSEEASAIVLAATVSKGACDIILGDGLEDVSTEVEDLVQQIDLGLLDFPADTEALNILTSHSQIMEGYREVSMNNEIYQEMPDEQRREISRIVDTVRLDSTAQRTLMSLDGKLNDESRGNEPMSAVAVKIPPSSEMTGFMTEDEADDLLRNLCVQALHSPDTTMFLSSRSPRLGRVSISAIRWRNGKWENVGEDETMFFLETSNIGTQLDIHPGDEVDYRRL